MVISCPILYINVRKGVYPVHCMFIWIQIKIHWIIKILLENIYLLSTTHTIETSDSISISKIHLSKLNYRNKIKVINSLWNIAFTQLKWRKKDWKKETFSTFTPYLLLSKAIKWKHTIVIITYNLHLLN